jgi:hypothetical protein
MLTTADLAVLLNTTYARVTDRYRVHDAITRGLIPAEKVKGRWMVRPEDAPKAAEVFSARA